MLLIEDIILGPPKTSFASASRISGKGLIDPTESPSRIFDSDELRTDRFNIRDKFLRERNTEDRDFDRRDGKPVTLNGRRVEREDWNSARSRRTFGHDEPERKPRRNGDFDRWEGRDINRDHDQRGEKDPRFLPRRDGQPARARHEGSWFRDDKNNHHHHQQEGPDADEEKPSVRHREWRRGDRHGADRDWTRGAKFEQEPEWLTANEKDEPRRAHTQEDFERWKEKMRAGSAQVHAEEKKPSTAEPLNAPVQKPEKRPTDGEIFSSSGMPFHGDATMERFFGLLSEGKPQEPPALSPAEVMTKEMAPAPALASAPAPAPAPPVPAPAPAPAPAAAAAATPVHALPKGKSSRFAGLFSPPPGSPAMEESASPLGHRASPVNASPKDADQEGFQRILAMLGGGGPKSRNATPHNDYAQVTRPSPVVAAEPAYAAVPSPSRDQVNRTDYMPPQDGPMRGADPALKDALFPPDLSAKDPQSREHLLRLMQQVRVSPGGPPSHGVQGPPPTAGPPPGLLNMADVMPHPPGIPTAHKGPSFMDDPAIADLSRPEAEPLRRRPANGPPPPMGYFDDIPFPQGNHLPMTPGGSRAPQGQGMPAMGIQRPPGFEHMPPPGWAGPQMPPQQGVGPGPLGPPPGIPTPTRGVNPNYIANMMPMPGGVPPLNERQPFPRGAAGAGSAGFPPPPGMMPPPGYMNGPLPGGFPPMPPNVEGLMGMGHGGQGPFDGNPGPQGPPPSSRHLLEMFGGADMRGGMVGPGQFR